MAQKLFQESTTNQSKELGRVVIDYEVEATRRACS